MRVGENCRKTLRVFPTKGLRSAARIICPSVTDKFHTGSPRSIFSHAHVARENDLISLPPAGGKLCEAFLTRCPDPRKRGSGLFFGAGRTRGRGEASAPTEVYLAVRRGGALPLPRAGKSAKRCQWQKKRAGFEEVPRLAATTVAGNRLARRWAREPCPYGWVTRGAVQVRAGDRKGRPYGNVEMLV